MESVLKSDIFFFITTMVIIIVGVFVVAVLIYIILILRDIKNVSTRVKDESKLLSEDIAALRDNVKKEGAKIRHFADFFGTIYKRNYKKRK